MSKNIKIHAIQGTVAIRPNQRQGKGSGSIPLLNAFIDHRWTEALLFMYGLSSIQRV